MIKNKSKLPEYQTWIGMKGRVKSDPYYVGVKVCAEWLTSFEAFYEHLGPKPTPKHSLDRINPYGHYEPGNCRWLTMAEQQGNKKVRLWPKGIPTKLIRVPNFLKKRVIEWCLQRIKEGAAP